MENTDIIMVDRDHALEIYRTALNDIELLYSDNQELINKIDETISMVKNSYYARSDLSRTFRVRSYTDYILNNDYYKNPKAMLLKEYDYRYTYNRKCYQRVGDQIKQTIQDLENFIKHAEYSVKQYIINKEHVGYLESLRIGSKHKELATLINVNKNAFLGDS